MPLRQGGEDTDSNWHYQFRERGADKTAREARERSQSV